MDEQLKQRLAERRRQIEATNSRIRQVRSAGSDRLFTLPAQEIVRLKIHERRCRFGGEENAGARQRIRELKKSGLLSYKDLSEWYGCSKNTIERVVKRRGNYKRW